jgi:predicted nucleic acid-binding protein
MKYDLDTCVISEFIKPKPNEKSIRMDFYQKFNDLCISVISFGEIWKGISMLSKSAKKEELKRWFENDIVYPYYSRALKIDYSIMIIWGELYAKLESDKKLIPVVDLFIAATSISYNFTLATRNTKDFINTGCKLFNPWE